MSQRNVERILGRLVTDEPFRRRFWEAPAAALDALASEGLALNSCERRSLLGLRSEPVEHLASALDPCIQKAAWRDPVATPMPVHGFGPDPEEP
jgi:hypothetical protein